MLTLPFTKTHFRRSPGTMELLRSNETGNGKLTAAFCLLLALAGVYWFFGQGPLPQHALKQAYEESSAETSLELLQHAKKDDHSLPWALLHEARLLVEQNKPSAAATVLSKIDQSSAAYLDAAVELYALGQDSKIPPAPLESLIKKADRRDLLPHWKFANARIAERQGNHSIAFHQYQNLRREHRSSPIAQKSRAAAQRLAAARPKLLSLASQLMEIELLTAEGQYDDAIARAEQLTQTIDATSTSYFETLLLKERALRQSGKRKEADQLLAVISADAPKPIAAKALLSLIKHAWNMNDHERALQFVDNFSNRFSRSDTYTEVLYIKARIQEEVKDSESAKSTYRALLAKKPALDQKLRALRQLAWIYMREKEYPKAAETLLEAKKNASNEDAEYLHYSYWLAYARGQIASGTSLPNELQSVQASEELAKLANEHATHFYGYKARENLNQASPTLDVDESTTCQIPIADGLSARVSGLVEMGMPELARHEINWHFALLPDVADSQEEIVRSTSRARLLASYGNVQSSISIAARLLAKDPITVPACKKALYALSFPQPFAEFFEDAAETYDIPVSLLYAVARTESHFDANANSIKNAQGLLQLLPSTAEAEGLGEGEDLYSPEVNIRLGAKHLAGLLKQYNGQSIYAIAAYNAGSTAVARWRERFPEIDSTSWIELIGYPETKNYVKKVLASQSIYTGRTHDE